MKQAMILPFVIFIILTAAIVMAHKEGAESAQSSGNLKITFGLLPTQIVVGEEQLFYIKVEDVNTHEPATGLDATFTIQRTNVPETKQTYETDEALPGQYVLKQIFPEAGNYRVEAKLADGGTVLSEQTKLVHAEPNGPSLFFWLYMLGAVVVGMIIASRSHMM